MAKKATKPKLAGPIPDSGDFGRYIELDVLGWSGPTRLIFAKDNRLYFHGGELEKPKETSIKGACLWFAAACTLTGVGFSGNVGRLVNLAGKAIPV
jgi:hypothetical protein